MLSFLCYRFTVRVTSLSYTTVHSEAQHSTHNKHNSVWHNCNKLTTHHHQQVKSVTYSLNCTHPQLIMWYYNHYLTGHRRQKRHQQPKQHNSLYEDFTQNLIAFYWNWEYYNIFQLIVQWLTWIKTFSWLTTPVIMLKGTMA